METNIEAVIDAVDAIYGRLRSEHRIPSEEIEREETRLGLVLPAALRSMYERTGRHPLHRAENAIVLPQQLRVINGHLIIYNESQLVCAWGISWRNLLIADPPVDSGTARDGSFQFSPEFTSVSQFFAFQVAWQGVGGALPFVGVILPSEELAGGVRTVPKRVLTSRDAQPVGELLANTMTAEVRFRSGAVAVAQDDGYFGLAATEEKTFRDVASTMSIDIEHWTYSTLRDEL